ncbi:MAG: histidine kinase dimerization/phosphoacceptor domain -containing protein [Synechocystis sp.]|nr:histidine kinase dimerization/phosphoacceptor domain -containing protein [Synechocystis sp.]
MDNHQSTFHLLTIYDQLSPRKLVLEKKQYSIGRNSDNLIMIRDLAISRYHCTIFPVAYKNAKDDAPVIFWIVDGDLLGNRSSNGLFVNGDRCYSHELTSGDCITFFGTDTYLEYRVATSVTEGESPANGAILAETSPQAMGEKSTTTLISQDTILTDLLDEIFCVLSRQGLEPALSSYQYYYLETHVEGQVMAYDGGFQSQFPLLIRDFASHPFTKFLRDDVMQSGSGVAIRRVKYRRKFYTQYARLDANNPVIKSYIFDFSIANEINAIRESEERYRAIFRQVSQGILLVDPQTLTIIEANQAYCNLVGYDCTNITTMTLPDLISGDHPILTHLIKSVLESRREICRESLHRHQDGTLIDVEEEISLIGYSTHKVICFAVRDISHRKQTERELQQSVKEKEILLKEIHHRVKNNLLVVSSLLDWRSESIADPALQSIFIESQRRIDTIALIHEKLYGTQDLAQIDFGDYLETLAVQIFESFSINEANPDRITLEFDLTPIYLNIETAMPCGLIVNELLLNTFKHAFPHQRKGTVTLGLKPQAKDQYLLVIQDNGVGFPEGFDVTQTDSLGWQLINLLTNQLDGSVHVKAGDGAQIELVFARQDYHRRV